MRPPGLARETVRANKRHAEKEDTQQDLMIKQTKTTATFSVASSVFLIESRPEIRVKVEHECCLLQRFDGAASLYPRQSADLEVMLPAGSSSETPSTCNPAARSNEPEAQLEQPCVLD